MNKVFLGGTCNNSTWRDELIPLLELNYFNPVVENWNKAAQEEEIRQKEEECTIHLYVITSEMSGVFSIAEVVESCFKRGIKTIFHVIPQGFDESQLKSLTAVVDLIKRNKGIAYVNENIEFTAELINLVFK